jgi:hypothetical protein
MKEEKITEEQDFSEDTYSKWYIFFTIPILSSLYFFWFVMKLLMSFIFSLGEEDRRDKTYVRYSENGIHKTGLSSTYKSGNLIRILIVGAGIYFTYKGIEACIKVFHASLETGVIFLLPLCIAGTASLLFSESFKKHLNNDKSSLPFIIVSFVGLAISIAITVYLCKIDFLEMGDSKNIKDGIFSLFFVPLFIFSGYILPIMVSLTSILLTLKDKNSYSIFAVIFAFLLGSIPPYMQYQEVQKNIENKKEEIRKEKEKIIQNKKRNKLREERYKEMSMNEKGFTYYSPEIISARYDPTKKKEEDDKRLTGTGKGSLLILPSYKFRVKVSVEGFENYTYGMEVPVGKYKITLEHEKYRKHKEIYEVKEGGNIIYIKMI